MVNGSFKTLSRQNDILSCSSIVAMFYSFIAVEFHYLAIEYINANNVMPFFFILQIKRGGISRS